MCKTIPEFDHPGSGVLKQVSGEASGRFIKLKAEVTVIGRSNACQIVLDSLSVSRRHAEIRRVGEKYFLTDLNARNLTKVNNKCVEPGKDHELQSGDRINICDVEFIYSPYPAREDDTCWEEVTGVCDTGEMEEVELFDANSWDACRSTPHTEIQLKAIPEIIRNLSSETKSDEVASKILDLLMVLFPRAERLLLDLIDPATKRLVRKAFKFRPDRGPTLGRCPDDEIPMSICRSIVNRVRRQIKAFLNQDAGNDNTFPTSASIADLLSRSVICVPLLAPDGHVLGILQIETSDRKQFLRKDLDVLAAVASEAAVAIQNSAMHA